jgi:hypothetical protein
MNALGDAGLLGGAVGPVWPVVDRTTRPPRTVEGSADAGLDVEDDRRVFASSAAVLQLVRSSAARFAEILELSDDVRTADVMTGFHASATTDTGSEVDLYA